MIPTPARLNRRAELYHQLGSMIAAGVPLIKALEMAANNSSLRSSRKTIFNLIQHLKNGLAFHDSMVREHGWMPEFDVALLSAGEQSGRLDASFKFLGQYYSARASIIRDTIAGLFLPAMNFQVFLLIFPLGLLTASAVGIMNNNYKPFVLFILEKILVFGLLYGVIVFFIFACQGKRGERWRSFAESLWQCFPLLRTALKYLALSRLTASLGALVNSGLSIIKCWPLAAAASGSPHLNREISRWGPELESGATPADLVSRTPYFPEMFANLYNTGEISGQLDYALNRLHIFYQEEGVRTLRMFSRITSGTIYGIVAALIAYNVITFYTHYYSGLINGNF